MSNTPPELEDWRFLVAVFGGGTVLLAFFAAHLKACYRTCKRRRPVLPPLSKSNSGPKHMKFHQDTTESEGRQTPSINEEEPLLGSGLTFDSFAAGSLPGADSFAVLPRTFLVWNIPLVWEGWFSTISRDRLPPLRKKFKSTDVADKVHGLWDKHVKQGSKNILRSSMFDLLRHQMLIGSIVAFAQGLLASVARPLILRYIINELMDKIDFDEALLLIVILAVVVLVEGWLGVLYRHLLCDDMGSTFITGMFSLMIRKVVYGNKAKPTKDGEVASNVLNLFGNDIMRRFRDCLVASNLPMAAGSLLGGFTTVIVFLGPESAIVGISVCVLFCVSTFFFAQTIGRVEKGNLRCADERMSVLSEIINSIKAVKFFAWELPYIEKIQGARTKECENIRSFRMLQVISITLGRACPVIAAASAIITYALLSGENLEPGTIFATVAVFQSLRLSLIVLPHAMAALANIKTSIVRINSFLITEDMPEKVQPLYDDDKCVLKMEDVDIGFAAADNVGVDIEVAMALLEKYNIVEDDDAVKYKQRAKNFSGKSILNHVNITVNTGNIVAIVGPVGSGKSALISTIIGDLKQLSGNIERNESVGFVPQKAVIISGTIQENILFGRPYNGVRMNECLRNADFLRDLSMMSNALSTEIGERGSTLSGGQQQRLSIARALYGNPKLLVMDDPLSAVDPEVCQRIFEGAVVNFCAKGGAVLMVTNQLHLLSRCHDIIYLENGHVNAHGTYHDLMGAGGSFSKLVSEHVFENNADEEDVKLDDSSFEVTQSKSKVNGGGATEKLESGAIKSSVYVDYIRSMGWGLWLFIVLTITTTYTALAFQDVWLSIWVSKSDSVNMTVGDGSDTEPLADLFNPPDLSDYEFIYVYAGALVIYLICGLAGSLMYTIAGFRASQWLHQRSIKRIMYAPYSWFQDTPLGRITSRFTTDLGVIDLELSFWLDNFTHLGLQFLSMISVMIVIIPYSAIPILLSTFVYAFSSKAVNRANREVKREANSAMGPLQSNMAEAVEARVLARVMKCDGFFIVRHHRLADNFNRANYCTFALLSWMQMVGVYVSFIISVSIGSFVILLQDEIRVEQSALVLTYSFTLPYFLSMLAMIVTNLGAYFTSLERVREFELLPQEPPHTLPADKDFQMLKWPVYGNVKLDDVKLRYSETDTMVLKGVNVEFEAGKKIGVVGRTGAGKSTIMNVLFRIIDPTEGRIYIDGVDTQTIGLEKLRKNVAIIPQEPILMNGTARYNLDPFNTKSTEEVKGALVRAHLPTKFLDIDLGATGEGLSMGQRQLLCFARAILHRAPILLMDEPTANCDLETDMLVQQMVRKEFASTTVITIAHRLNTIIDYDKILVLGDGKVLEFGAASELLENPDGELTRMVAAMGSGAEAALRRRVGL